MACQESEAGCKFTVAACNNSAAAVIRESASACRALAVEVACGGTAVVEVDCEGICSSSDGGGKQKDRQWQ